MTANAFHSLCLSYPLLPKILKHRSFPWTGSSDCVVHFILILSDGHNPCKMCKAMNCLYSSAVMGLKDL